MYFELPGREVRWDTGLIRVAQPYELPWTDLYDVFTPLRDPIPLSQLAPGSIPVAIDPRSFPSYFKNPAASQGQLINLTPNLPGGGLLVVVPANPKRNLLVIQNNSSATGAGNVAPTLVMALDGPIPSAAINPPIAAQYLNFPPGQGLVLTTRVPTNDLYFVWTTGTGTFVQGGMVLTGSTPE